MDPQESSAEQAERQRRLDAIGALARQHHQQTQRDRPAHAAIPPAGAPRQAPRPAWRRRWLWAALAVVVVLAAVVGGVVLCHQTQRIALPTRPLQITSVFADLACIVDTAWSPGGRQIAVIGYQSVCPEQLRNSPYVSGKVEVFDATTGHLAAQWTPDALLLQGQHVSLESNIPDPNNGPPFAPAIGYSGILWSPDGQRLALPFVVFQARYLYPDPYEVPPQLPAIPPGRTAATTGVLITAVDGTTPQIVTAPYTFPQTTTPIAGQEWDLQAGTLLSAGVALPPALSYRWSASGGPLPQAVQPLTTSAPPSASPLGPVGTPLGGQAFTLWQPGWPTGGIDFLSTPQRFVPDVHEWYPHFAIWSPDGPYLIAPAYYGGRVQMPGLSLSTQVLTATGQAQAPVLPVRNAALQAIYQSDQSITAVAWRPDGQVLAASAVQSITAQTFADAVTLYNCATGKVLARFVVGPPVAAGIYPGLFGLGPSTDLGVWLRWSPDGARLMLFSGARNAITIWGPGLLPKG